MTSIESTQGIIFTLWAVAALTNILVFGYIGWFAAQERITKWRLDNIDREFRVKHRANLITERGILGAVKRFILEVTVAIMSRRLARHLAK